MPISNSPLSMLSPQVLQALMQRYLQQQQLAGGPLQQGSVQGPAGSAQGPTAMPTAMTAVPGPLALSSATPMTAPSPTGGGAGPMADTPLPTAAPQTAPSPAGGGAGPSSTQGVSGGPMTAAGVPAMQPPAFSGNPVRGMHKPPGGEQAPGGGNPFAVRPNYQPANSGANTLRQDQFGNYYYGTASNPLDYSGYNTNANTGGFGSNNYSLNNVASFIRNNGNSSQT